MKGRALKEAIASVDAVLFVTPEYNRPGLFTDDGEVTDDTTARYVGRLRRFRCG